MTRAELIADMAARRVVVDQVRGDLARITVARDRSSTIATVPTDWIKPLDEPRTDAQREVIAALRRKSEAA